NGVVSGNGGCNDYSGGYQVNGQTLTVSALGTTSVQCADDVMAQEAIYLDGLQGARGYEIVGNRLRIFGVAGDQEVELFYTAQQ
ncbi:MAG: META domain-containing protein, partial [Anaerolineae bacterium]|nr:META domain-containing protein [Anaerolineae bacterium]